MTDRTILHAGCGGQDLPPWFPIKGDEVKLDADAAFKPHIVASIDNLGDIGPFDAIYCCHCLEHLHWNDAMKALSEFFRVLKPGGVAFVQVPDLEDVKPDDTVHYVTEGGLQITGLDMYYGYREFSYRNSWMMHGCGFMQKTLTPAMEHAGFTTRVFRSGFDLLGIGTRPE